MRLTLELKSFKDFGETAFASLWLDTRLWRWSRESHELLELPKWGIVVPAAGETHLCGQTESAPRVIACLENLNLDKLVSSTGTHDFNAPPGPHNQSRGRALLYELNNEEKKPSEGRWRVLFIDRETTVAERSNFTDETG